LEKPTPPRPILPILAGIALLLLLVLPATRWLFLTQLRMELLHGQQIDLKAEEQAARNHPGVYPIQLAAALLPQPLPPNVDPPATTTQNRVRLQRLQDLAARFPDAPSAPATILRYLTLGEVRLHRDEESLYSGIEPKHQPGDKQQSDPELLAMFDQAAETGERTDPDNAYFPIMRAISLFDEHRDDEALAEIQRAGEKSYWDDYCTVEADGQLRLNTETYGERGTLNRVAMQAAILFPHFSAIRGVARMAMYKATEAELAGRKEEGLAIRMALMRVGSTMRVQSPSYIGTLVGIAISAISTGRPGGAPAIKLASNEESTEEKRQQLQQERLSRYYDYLRSFDHAEEVRLVQKEMAAGNEAKEIGSHFQELPPFGKGTLNTLFGVWAANIVMLSNMLLLLALGVAAWAATRIKPRKNLVAWRVSGCLLLGLGILAWLWGVLGVSAKPYFELALELANMSDHPSEINATVIMGVLMGLSLFVPLLSLTILAIASKAERIPVATGVGRGIRRLALPLASLLFLVYGGLLCVTVRQEAAMDQSLQRMAQHEGNYLAELVGKPWPGPVR